VPTPCQAANERLVHHGLLGPQTSLKCRCCFHCPGGGGTQMFRESSKSHDLGMTWPGPKVRCGKKRPQPMSPRVQWGELAAPDAAHPSKGFPVGGKDQNSNFSGPAPEQLGNWVAHGESSTSPLLRRSQRQLGQLHQRTRIPGSVCLAPFP
jgi:hypothetical protein